MQMSMLFSKFGIGLLAVLIPVVIWVGKGCQVNKAEAHLVQCQKEQGSLELENAQLERAIEDQNSKIDALARDREVMELRARERALRVLRQTELPELNTWDQVRDYLAEN